MGKFVAWQIYWLVVLALGCIGYWKVASTETQILINEFIKEFYPTILGLGTVFLISFLTLLTTIATNYSTERRETQNRRVSAELKIAEFRQIWINEQRKDIAEFGALTLFRQDGRQLKKLSEISGRINLRFNRKEENKYIPIRDAMKKMMNARSDEDNDQMLAEYENLLELSNMYLKDEWDRLKRDLKNAQAANDL